MCAALAAVGCDGAEARAGEIRASIDARRAEVVAEDERMREALAEPPPPREGCAVVGELGGGATLLTTGAEDEPSRRVAELDESTAELRERAASISEGGARAWLARVSRSDWFRYELVVVASEYVAPSFDGAALTQQFQGGRVAGRAIVWDHHEGEAVCAADVVAESSEEISSSLPTAASSLNEITDAEASLGRRLRADLAENVRAASLAAFRGEAAAP